MFSFHHLLILAALLSLRPSFCLTDISNGFIVYCPCMGRFGNQAEQLLGSLLFARSLNRTLVLPPFIYYGEGHKPHLVPFDKFIQVDPIKEYHDVVLLKDFLSQWPSGERIFFCHSARAFKSTSSCDALEGEPFRTFWTSHNITEDVSVFYSPLSTNPKDARAWYDNYPSSDYPVLAFVGAPSPFPTHNDAVSIQKYLKFSSQVAELASGYKRSQNFSSQPYLSVHLRRGIDWGKACELLKTNYQLKRLFSSNQCTGYSEDAQKPYLQYDTCFPADETIVKNIRGAIRYYFRKTGKNITTVHVGTDADDSALWSILRTQFPELRFLISPSRDRIQDVMIDVYLMANADIFIGNCVSSFTAFPARLRTEQYDLKSMTLYFGQFFDVQLATYVRDEL